MQLDPQDQATAEMLFAILTDLDLTSHKGKARFLALAAETLFNDPTSDLLTEDVVARRKPSARAVVLAALDDPETRTPNGEAELRRQMKLVEARTTLQHVEVPA